MWRQPIAKLSTRDAGDVHRHEPTRAHRHGAGLMSALPTLPTAMEELPRSGIRAVMDRAWELGEPITHLEVGEPGFATPTHIVDTFCRSVVDGATRYTPNAGIEPLRIACVRV